MKIAAAAHGCDTKAVIGKRLQTEDTLFILELDDDTGELMTADPMPKTASILELALLIVENDCEAVISGIIEKEGFDILAKEQVTRYKGTGLTVLEAVEKMAGRQLELFTHAEGESHSHEHGALYGQSEIRNSKGKREEG
ncbi:MULTISPECIES: hypothetical protein [Anoxynatronum]|uniref:Dinitrogenase iron-molybdenum cofactor biosynthesis domain-containing protein n=2 Tax=Anoxynatronum TaxID=210622 RepID=A0AA45WT23_9CLOT|nr:hypothetical protein [Anoxynatronum buryatiense]SMP40035.1 hypothetical protein SAMN06296020_101317 [Anoxynatronum buryatiense]